MCGLLLENLKPDQLRVGTFIPKAKLGTFGGDPLDFLLRAGSLPAVKALWEQGYMCKNTFYESLSLSSEEATAPIIGSFPFEISKLEIAAIKFLSSMNPSLWTYFLSKIPKYEQDYLIQLKTNPDRVINGKPAGLFGWGLIMHAAHLTTTTRMIQHGPEYTHILVSHINCCFNFLGDTSKTEWFEAFMSVGIESPDLALKIAIMEVVASSECDETKSSVLLKDIKEGPETNGAPFRRPSLESIKALRFAEFVEAEKQGASLGHMLGFMMPSEPQPNILDALAAAALVDDHPAFKRIVINEIRNDRDLTAIGAHEYLLAKFAPEWPRKGEDYLLSIRENFGQSHGIITKLTQIFRRRFWQPAVENAFAETGCLVWDAVKYNNLDLLLFLLAENPSIITNTKSFHSSLMHTICVNDYHTPLLSGLLEALGPEKSITALRLRNTISGISPIDVALFFNSQQCLLIITSFLLKWGISVDAIYYRNPKSQSITRFDPMLANFTRGTRLLHKLSPLIQRYAGYQPQNLHADGVTNKNKLNLTQCQITAMHFLWDLPEHETWRARMKEKIKRYVLHFRPSITKQMFSSSVIFCPLPDCES